jgi:hypothetical protein
LGVFSTATAHPGLHKRNNTWTGGAATNRAAGFTTGLARFAGRVDRTALRVRATPRVVERVRLFRDALIVILSTTSTGLSITGDYSTSAGQNRSQEHTGASA